MGQRFCPRLRHFEEIRHCNSAQTSLFQSIVCYLFEKVRLRGQGFELVIEAAVLVQALSPSLLQMYFLRGKV